MLYEDKILQMALAKKKKENKKGAKKGDAPTDLVVLIMKRLRVRMSYPSRGENPKERLGQNREPLHVKTPNGARGKKLKGASPGENLERGAWISKKKNH